ncbi:hypothetical protein AB6E39_06875 [Vibrio splendidus]|uniref:hypothetical protein n=1 Tax=Vibrio splendidus TaxID=29497 RepID=UPI001E445BDE|nr:hypothetical protein [Vibrio splendidus]MCC4787698.1 hypothetical protein [Vibrio splendidus]
MQLNKDIKKATQTLEAICAHIKDENFKIEVTQADIKRVKRVLGIDINLTHHSKIETLYELKDKPISIYINNAAYGYLNGKSKRTYMPFQIKKMKEVIL